jgi:sterol desaturase/sphingolipid hydroxylase (fatty acid hydroxylase superfamily)
MILLSLFISYILVFQTSSYVFMGIMFCIFFYLFIYIIIKKSTKINQWVWKIKYEITYTTISFLIFTTILTLYMYLFKLDILYFDFNFSLYSILLWALFIFWHDLYFYIIHRLLHQKFLFKYIHYVHHKSNPSNIFSSYSFHPIEALLYIAITGIIFIWGVNFYALLIAAFVSDFLTIIWHSWYELFSRKFSKNPLFKIMATTSYHDLHHSRNSWNIALYFTYLDKIFWTYDSQYKDNFINIKR